LQKPNQIKLFMYNRGSNRYCGAEPQLGSLTPTASQGGWFQYTVPLSAFDCADLGDVTRFDLQNVAERNAPVCIAEVRLE
jgi:hypothetical protein